MQVKDKIRLELINVLQRHTNLLDNTKRCRSIIADHICPLKQNGLDIDSELYLINLSLERGIPQELIQHKHCLGTTIPLLAVRLEKFCCLTPESALWAVETWAIGLQLKMGGIQIQTHKAPVKRPPQAPTQPVNNAPVRKPVSQPMKQNTAQVQKKAAVVQQPVWPPKAVTKHIIFNSQQQVVMQTNCMGNMVPVMVTGSEEDCLDQLKAVVSFTQWSDDPTELEYHTGCLFGAVIAGHEKVVDYLLRNLYRDGDNNRRKINVNSTNSHKENLLNIAVSKGNRNIVSMLLSHGADINYGGGEAIWYACKRNDFEMMKLLHIKGSCVPLGVFKDTLERLKKVGKTDSTILRYFIGQGVSLREVFQSCIYSKSVKDVQILLTNGADANEVIACLKAMNLNVPITKSLSNVWRKI